MNLKDSLEYLLSKQNEITGNNYATKSRVEELLTEEANTSEIADVASMENNFAPEVEIQDLESEEFETIEEINDNEITNLFQ